MENFYPKIIIKRGKENSISRFHPWIFSGAIKNIDGSISDGDIAEVHSIDGRYLATGHYQTASIAVRIFSFNKANIDSSFWLSKISDAYNYRKSLGLTQLKDTNVFRLVNAEGDNLPGLIIDYYNGNIVIQTHSIGMSLLKQEFVLALQKIFGENLISVYDKSSETLPKENITTTNNKYLFGKLANTEALEHGNKFFIDWENGQKTGFYIDQRENRLLLTRFVKDKTVLNAFCYTGGFSVYALKAGAKEVHSVDASKHAIDLTNKNIAMNTNNEMCHKSFVADVFDFLQNTDTQYDIIILDPPAFAKHISAKHHAVQGYKRLNTEALKKINPGGILFTFSCSQAIDRRLFYNTILSAAINTGRRIKVIHHLSQPADHPVNIYHPEGEYLKGLVAYVE